MNQDEVIKVDGVSKTFRLPHEARRSIKSLFVNIGKRNKSVEVQQALNNISFTIKEGEFFGILGRNGSGKSTLLKILAGIYQPTAGRVVTRGKLVPFIELGVGFNPELTGRENVYLNSALLGFSPEQTDAMYDDIVEFAELERFMDQKLKNYSSGMQVRLAFSVATRAKADILLIDEVLAVGDADFQRKCFEYFKKLKKDKKTVVFVSHDMSAVREYCDRAILVDDSKIIFSGSAERAAKEYTRLFLPEVYKAQTQEERTRKHRASQRKVNEVGKWGSGGLDIVDVQTTRNVYNTDDEFITIEYVIRADSGFTDEIIPGITIKDEQGRAICGTNSEIIARPNQKITIGGELQKITTTWKVPNVFSQGKYTIEPAVLSGTTTDTLQWWDDAASFRVVNEESTPHPISPRITLTVTEKQ